MARGDDGFELFSRFAGDVSCSTVQTVCRPRKSPPQCWPHSVPRRPLATESKISDDSKTVVYIFPFQIFESRERRRNLKRHRRVYRLPMNVGRRFVNFREMPIGETLSSHQSAVRFSPSVTPSQTTSHDGYSGCRDVRQGHQGANPRRRARRRRPKCPALALFPDSRV